MYCLRLLRFACLFVLFVVIIVVFPPKVTKNFLNVRENI